MLLYLLFICVIFSLLIMARSLAVFISSHSHHSKGSHFSLTYLSIFLLVYIVFILGFSLLYLSLELIGLPPLAFNNTNPMEISPSVFLGNLLYFSTMTMLTVGYGDVTPIGWAKLFAGIQAFIGYLLPTAFLIKGFLFSIDNVGKEDNQRRRDRYQANEASSSEERIP